MGGLHLSSPARKLVSLILNGIPMDVRLHYDVDTYRSAECEPYIYQYGLTTQYMYSAIVDCLAIQKIVGHQLPVYSREAVTTC